MKNLSIWLFCLSFCVIAQAEDISYLEEKTVFCDSEYSLTKYLSMAKVRYWEGLNKLVADGECNFVPDGSIFRLKKVTTDSIEETPVIAFEQNNEILWTFKVFVKNSTTSDL